MVPRLLSTSRDSPREPSLKTPFSYGVVSLFGPRFAQVVPYTTSLLEAVWGPTRLHEMDPGCTFVTVMRETYYAPSEALVVVLIDTLLPQLFV